MTTPDKLKKLRGLYSSLIIAGEIDTLINLVDDIYFEETMLGNIRQATHLSDVKAAYFIWKLRLEETIRSLEEIVELDQNETPAYTKNQESIFHEKEW